MLLALIVCHLTVLITANPFQRYPFVFLLDIGNEELEKTNTEQIRVSVPGGSIALRYPAIGDGDTIGHVRVSGIDFGTDLKASIVDGGPGYKYVVFVLMGNPGVPYDAVVTVQTVKDKAVPDTGSNEVDNFENNDVDPTKMNVIENVNSDQNEVDANNSAEDLSDTNDNTSSQSQYIENSNAEVMQPSSNIYKYAQSEVNEEVDDDESPGDDDDEEQDAKLQSYDAYEVSENNDEQKDIHVEYKADEIVNQKIDDVDADDENVDDDEVKADKYSSDYANDEPTIVDSNLYSKYEALKPHLFNGEVYSQDNVQQNSKPSFQQDPMDYEDPAELNQVFNDDDGEDDNNKYKDSNNNNYVDLDESSAVAY